MRQPGGLCWPGWSRSRACPRQRRWRGRRDQSASARCPPSKSGQVVDQGTKRPTIGIPLSARRQAAISAGYPTSRQENRSYQTPSATGVPPYEVDHDVLLSCRDLGSVAARPQRRAGQGGGHRGTHRRPCGRIADAVMRPPFRGGPDLQRRWDEVCCRVATATATLCLHGARLSPARHVHDQRSPLPVERSSTC
jgi:hypothetical protein